jgi:hypothetical protein
VYYHSAAPFVFLRNLTTLGDAIYLGGFCANKDRLAAPLVTFEHDGHSYRAQPFRDALASDGGGIHPTGYYFVPEDLAAFFTRQGFDYETIDLEETPLHKQGGYYVRALARRTSY